MEAAFSTIESSPPVSNLLRFPKRSISKIPKPLIQYERDPDSTTYGFRDICIGRRIALAQKMARKQTEQAERAERSKQLQTELTNRTTIIQGLASLAGQRAIVTFKSGLEEDLFIAGMTEYTGKIKPNYNSQVSAAVGMHPENANNPVVCRVPDQMDDFFAVSLDRIESFRPRTDEDMPLLWQGDNS